MEKRQANEQTNERANEKRSEMEIFKKLPSRIRKKEAKRHGTIMVALFFVSVDVFFYFYLGAGMSTGMSTVAELISQRK